MRSGGRRARKARTALALSLALAALGLSGGLVPPVAGGATAPAPRASPSLPLAAAAGHPAAAAWINRTASLASAPPASWGSSMAYDASDGYLLFFGGLGSSRGALRETWSWQDGSWTNLTGDVGPAPSTRYEASMAYDPALGAVVLFGGIHAGGYLSDTWTFANGSWSELSENESPPGLAGAALGYDPAESGLILYGGTDAAGTVLNTTWLFAGGVWTNLTGGLSTSPPPLADAGMTFDAAANGSILFGGTNGHRSFNETWKFAGGHWANRTSPTAEAPMAREFPGLVYDAVDGYDLLFGGYSGDQVLNDSWAYANGSWTRLPSGPAPSPRNAMAMGYTPGLREGNATVVLFGGRAGAAASSVGYSDTWTYKAPLAAALRIVPSEVDIDHPANISLSASGGYPPYNLSWRALPAGCVGPLHPGWFDCSSPLAQPYSISAIVKDAANESVDTGAVELTVNATPTVAAPTASPSPDGEAPLDVQFTARPVGGTAPYAYAWSFGDENGSTARAPSHIYPTPGSYSVTVTITDADGENATSPPLRVVVTPAFSVTASASAYVGVAPLTVRFVAQPVGGAGPFAFTWHLGGPGLVFTGAETNYTYTTPGNYSVSLEANDTYGASASTGFTETVIAPLSTTFSESFPVGPVCANGTVLTYVELDAEPRGGEAPYNATWDVNGTRLYGPSPSLTLPGGSYLPVNLTVTDARGDRTSFQEGLRVPTTACGTTAASGGGVSGATLFEAEVAGVVLLVVIAVEAVVLARRRPPAG